MNGAAKKRYDQLCRQATDQQDPERLARIIDQINQLLEAEFNRLHEKQTARQDANPPRDANPLPDR